MKTKRLFTVLTCMVIAITVVFGVPSNALVWLNSAKKGVTVKIKKGVKGHKKKASGLGAQGIQTVQLYANGVLVSTANPLPVTTSGGGGGGTVVITPGSYAFTPSNPTIATATSTTIVAAGSYHYIEIQDNATFAIVISLSAAAITSITPGSGNSVIVLQPGQEWASPPGAVPSGGITAYQASGASTNALTVVTG